MPTESEGLAGLVGREVVIDTNTSYVYVGTLESVGADFLTLKNADVHDIHDSSVTKEIYIHETRKHGVRPSRERVVVRLAHVVSFSLLGDVTQY